MADVRCPTVTESGASVKERRGILRGTWQKAPTPGNPRRGTGCKQRGQEAAKLQNPDLKAEERWLFNNKAVLFRALLLGRKA